jgi:hypothetical protein
MLSLATLGMAAYGAYSTVAGVIDLLATRQLEIWADVLLILFGVVLVVAAAFVRVLMPGGLALAMGALLGLQALALHNAAHLYQDIAIVPQVARGVFAAILVLLAYVGARRAGRS